MKRRDFIKRTGQIAGASLLTGCINSHDYWDPLVDENTPKLISGLKLWLKGDAGITIATGVSNWADQSGNGNNATQGAGAFQPAFIASESALNNRPVLSFDGTNDRMSGTPFPISLDSTIITVTYPTTNVISRVLFSAGNSFNTQFQSHQYNSNMRLMCGGIALDVAHGIIPTINTPYIFVSTATSISPTLGLGSTYLNGVTGNTDTNGLISGSTNYTVGRLLTNTQPFSGYIGEIIVYDRVLSDVDRQRVENYCSVKYAISLTI